MKKIEIVLTNEEFIQNLYEMAYDVITYKKKMTFEEFRKHIISIIGEEEKGITLIKEVI